MQKQICVVGLGYVGLPTAVLLADRGATVIGYDINAENVEMIIQGKPCIKETDLDDLLVNVVNAGKLTATTTPVPADVYIIAVPTPIKSDSSPDMDCVINAVSAISPFLQKGNLIILESTSPVGSTQMLAKHLQGLLQDLDFCSQNPDILMAYCPERILPGDAIAELVNNSRNIGGLTDQAALEAKKIYNIFCEGELNLTNAKTAEFAKLVENSYRDLNIAFANELSIISEKYHINVHELIALANKHPRVNILTPGIGVGGHCIPVDPWFIVHDNPATANLIRQSRLTNDYKPKFIANQIIETLRATSGKTVGILGLTYKPKVDDFRESPSITVVHQLSAEPSCKVFVHDPYFKADDKHLASLTRISDAQALIDQVDVLLIATSHDCYAQCDFSRHLAQQSLFDPAGFVRRFS